MYPEFKEFEKLAKGVKLVPVCEELLLDTMTPIGLFLRFAGSVNSFLLESVEGGERWARYSYIGRNPFMVFTSKDNVMMVQKGGSKSMKTGNPFFELQSLLREYKSAKPKGMPRFCGGAVGFIGYDMVRHIENLPNMPFEDVKLPDSYLAFYDEVIIYDHLKQRVLVAVNAHIDGDILTAYQKASGRIRQICAELTAPVEAVPPHKHNASSELKPQSSFTREEYFKAVERAKEYIKNGDIFQVVLSQKISAQTDVDPFDVYRVLRSLNPSPYLYYLKLPEAQIVGSSPELLIRVEGKTAETCPIAGTRPRGKDAAEDERLEKELLADEKELAEHTMLVDLGRNDIGKIAQFGTVKVINPMHVQRYSHVMHIVSNVAGEMREDKDCFDALGAVLPAGTLSGAPKVRAMQIIDELEPVKRGVYGGCIGYIGFNGDMDTCIAIRTIVFHHSKAYIQAGGGIVADSVPENEYQETLNKAQALLTALKKAGELE